MATTTVAGAKSQNMRRRRWKSTIASTAMPTNKAIIAARRCDRKYAYTTGGMSNATNQRSSFRHLKSRSARKNTNSAFM